MKLNLGCQVHYFDGWTNQDIVSDDTNIKAELFCDAAELPFPDDSVDCIYAGHLIEHFYPDTVQKALEEWRRVLKPGGRLIVVTPDSGQIFDRYAKGEVDIESCYQQVYGRIYSYDRESERHHMIFDWASLQNLFTGRAWVGTQMENLPKWSKVEPMNFDNPPEELAPFMGTHISRSLTQLGLIATK